MHEKVSQIIAICRCNHGLILKTLKSPQKFLDLSPKLVKMNQYINIIISMYNLPKKLEKWNENSQFTVVLPIMTATITPN